MNNKALAVTLTVTLASTGAEVVERTCYRPAYCDRAAEPPHIHIESHVPFAMPYETPYLASGENNLHASLDEHLNLSDACGNTAIWPRLV